MRSATLSFGIAATLVSSVYATDAPVCTGNPLGAQYTATLPASDEHSISGSIVINSAPDGVGANVQVAISGLPTEGGPFAYHIHELPVDAQGNCTSTGGHLDPYGRTDDPPCDASNPQSCEVGDLSGKHGKMENGTSFSANYVDQYLSLIPGTEAFIGNRSIVLHLADSSRVTCANLSRAGANSTTSSKGGMSGAGSYGSGSGPGSASSSCSLSSSVLPAPAGSPQDSVGVHDKPVATVVVPVGSGSGSGQLDAGMESVPAISAMHATSDVQQTPASDVYAIASSEPTDGVNCSTVTILTTVSTEHGGQIYTISGAIIESTSPVPTMATFTIVDNDETYTTHSTGMAAQTVTFTSEFDYVSTGMVPMTTTVSGETTGVNVENVRVTETLTMTSEGETMTITTVSSEGVGDALSNSILGDQMVYTTVSDGETMTITSEMAPTDAGNTIIDADGQTITEADGATITEDDAGNTILQTPATPPSDATITEAVGDVADATQTVAVQTDNSAATMAAGAGAGIGALALAVMLL